jgi:glycosyltransferase involved in cell wall biosynthesis
VPGGVYRVKILFLSDNFPPEVNAPASRTYEHCRYWASLGHDVTVVTCAPNFPKGRVFPVPRNRLWHTEMIDGVRVVRVWSFITANQGFFRRTLDYVSYMLSAILAAPFLGRPDVVVATSPQFFAACAGYVVSRMRRAPFIFELRDLWPDSIKAVGVMKQSSLVRMLERVEMFLYRKASGIVTVTDSFRTVLGGRGVDVSKIQVVTNGVDLSRFCHRPRDAQLSKALDLDGKFVVGYVGTLGLAHGLETVLDAAELAKSWPDGDRYRFLLLGDGACKQGLMASARERGLTNVQFLDTVPKEQVARYWSLLDVSVIHLRKSELFEGVIPSKLFECMGMGIPVLHGVPGESAAIVKEEGVGVVFESGNAQELADGILRISRDGALRARLQAACTRAAPNYERSSLAQKMLGFLGKYVPEEREPVPLTVVNAGNSD